MATWLFKSEPSSYSIHDLERDGSTQWTGVRNYQARNFMRGMKVGDRVIVYHSNAKPSGAVGIAKVTARAQPDPTQFDRSTKYYDAKSHPEQPTWHCVEIQFTSRFERVVPLAELNDDPKLAGMLLTSSKASRLSVQPLGGPHFNRIVKLGARPQ